jgi:hypothetical protein
MKQWSGETLFACALFSFFSFFSFFREKKKNNTTEKLSLSPLFTGTA